MKPGSKVWVRIGRERRPVLGVLMEVDLSADRATVLLPLTRGRRLVERRLKRVYHKRPKSLRDER